MNMLPDNTAIHVKLDKLYMSVNKGKTRPYRITRNNAKHFRHELVDGRLQLIAYCGPGTGYPGSRNVIELTPEDAETKLSHMGLVPVERGSAANIITTEVKSDPSLADPSATDKTVDASEIDIPADWDDHSDDQILNWAGLISGQNIRSMNRAKKIIKEHLNDSSDIR